MPRRLRPPRYRTPPRTAWHPQFVVVTEMSLDGDAWRVLDEYRLTREPMRIDVVVVRRRPGAASAAEPTYLRSVFERMREHNLFLYTGPTDALTADDASDLWTYTGAYLRHAAVDDLSTVSVRVVASSITPRFRARLASMGVVLSPTGRAGVEQAALGASVELRVIASAVAGDGAGEALLAALSSRVLDDEAHIAASMDDQEKARYATLCRYVERFTMSSIGQHTRDHAVADRSTRKLLAKVVRELPTQIRLDGIPYEVLLEGIPAEQRLEGIPAQQRLEGIPAQQRLEGIPAEQRLAGLSPGEALLSLPDDALRALSPSYIATLPDDVQGRIRARIG